MCRAKIKKQNCDLTELRRSHADLLADRDRSLKYNDEQEKTIQSMKEINKELKHVMKIFYTVVSPEHFFLSCLRGVSPCLHPLKKGIVGLTK